MQSKGIFAEVERGSVQQSFLFFLSTDNLSKVGTRLLWQWASDWNGLLIA